jgi:hypothetical protein
MERITESFCKRNLKSKTYRIPPDPTKRDLILHLEADDDASGIIADLRNEGYDAELRDFTV